MKYNHGNTTIGLRRRNGLKADAVVVALVVAIAVHFDACFGFSVSSLPAKRPIGFTASIGRSVYMLTAKHPCRFQEPKYIPSSTTSLMGMWSQNDEIEGSDRVKACIPYLLPLIDGDHFGKYIYERVPFMEAIDQVTIGPLAELGHSIPFLSLGLFMALTLGTRFNTNMSRNLRFSAQQAALIDVALLFPELIGSGFAEDPLPRYIAEPCCNFVWYAYMSVVVYCLVSNLRGKKPDQIPYLSNSADMMVGPF